MAQMAASIIQGGSEEVRRKAKKGVSVIAEVIKWNTRFQVSAKDIGEQWQKILVSEVVIQMNVLYNIELSFGPPCPY